MVSKVSTSVAEEIKGVTQPSQQKQGTEMGLPRKDLMEDLLVCGVDPHDTQETHTCFENVNQQKHCQLGLKRMKWKRAVGLLKFYRQEPR